MDPNLPIKDLPGIGRYYSQKLKRLDIKTVEDLVYHFPFRYDDFSKIETIGNVKEGEKLSIQGIVWQIKNIRTPRGKFVTTATVADQSGTIEVIWFNQPFLTKNIKAGMQISLSGKVDLNSNRLRLISPAYEIIRTSHQLLFESEPIRPETHGRRPQGRRLQRSDQSTLHTGRLVPIYPETEGLSSKWLRAKIAKILPHYLKVQKDYLPQEIILRLKLENLDSALFMIHFPKDYHQAQKGRKRLAFDELFLIQLITALRKKEWHETKVAPSMKVPQEQIASFIRKLPFKLTNAQEKAINEILTDMQRELPTNRLLEGDVGSGKTVVAAAASYITFLNGYDTLLAAPTEILTFQHQKTLEQILSPYAITVGIWTGSRKTRGQITCGTHALLTTFKAQRPVGLVIVDEQHRFGVAQRAKLFLDQSKELTPHLLTMTATPIPRTLALTLYGDLDLSVLDEMPAGRKAIATFLVPNHKRNDAYKFIEKQIGEGRQAFIITPFVEPSETMATVRAAKDEFEKLKGKFSPKIKLGLLHGRLKSKEKEAVINEFKNGQINILVATPVVEVGIDVPNAVVMMIESADRFGLAQLHQLRGRVGRGGHKSYCLLFSDSHSENSIKRLKSMERVHVGFELAEIDLKMRGPGEVFGLKQSGFVNLKLADLSNQRAIAQAQNEAKKLVEKDSSLTNCPLLTQKIARLQSEYIQPN